MKQKPTHSQLAVKALGSVLQRYANKNGTTTDSAVRDILTDLRHICDDQGLDFAERDQGAYEVYCEEKAEDRRQAQQAADGKKHL